MTAVIKLAAKPKHPLLEALTNLQVGEHIDVEDDNCAIAGNYISARISMWKRSKKLEGNYSRRRVAENVIRVFKIQ